MAALVHVAEHHGFEYGQSIGTGHKKTLVLIRMYRKGSLQPLPGARDAVARTKDRIMFDVLSSHAADKPRKMPGHGMRAVLALVLLASGKPLVALVGGGMLAEFLTGAFKWGEIRRQQITARLTGAAFVPVRDGSGRQGFLRPGQQLPGHAEPFAA
ncbi:hypothetical protein ACFYNW_18970 [Streptomyces virginiae]|uniref:hypothetical protein n=1 Tax=Streptomyces virginiae TaxID=1961 RepID=UPI0033AE605B